MMTAQRWNAVKKMSELPLDIFYEYYKEKGGTFDFSIFSQQFPLLLQGQHVFNLVTQQWEHIPHNVRCTNGMIVPVSHEIAIHRMYEYYDNKFEGQETT